MREPLKEAESETCGATNRNRIEGGADQGERARNREALATKTVRVVNPALVQGQPMILTWGELASCLKGRRCRTGASSQQRP